jgi:hypothetical protein
MNKTTFVLLLLFTLIMTACGGNAAPNAAAPASGTQGNPGAGELSASMQVAIGTIKLEGSDQAVTAEQAKELLPLWQTLNVLYSSDTAATQEIDALVTQIQETMTAEQTQAITALNLTRRDMMSIMQEQGLTFGGANSNAQSSNSTTNSGGGFGPGGGGFQGPPDGGGFPDGGPSFQRQDSSTQSTGSTDATTRAAALNPNRVPTPLVNAVIEYLKKKAGS